eukprot:4053044-Alexandrium_andersonii.AAC.1
MARCCGAAARSPHAADGPAWPAGRRPEFGLPASASGPKMQPADPLPSDRATPGACWIPRCARSAISSP